MYPGLASWAKVNRPCGTKLANPGFSHTLFSPCVFFMLVLVVAKKTRELRRIVS
jgi:hypothetical protein